MKNRHIAFVLIALLAFQSVMASDIHICRKSDMTGHVNHEISGPVQQKHAMHHDNATEHRDHTNLQSACDCGNYCAGTCMHTCNGTSMIAILDLELSVEHTNPLNLATGPFIPGYRTVPLRPPAIS